MLILTHHSASPIILPSSSYQNINKAHVEMREVRCWTTLSEAILQHVLSDVDGNMFQSNSDIISEFTEVVSLHAGRQGGCGLDRGLQTSPSDKLEVL